MYDYPGIEKGDLPLHRGQKVFIFDNSTDHWWRARNENGLVNKNVRMTPYFIYLLCRMEGFVPCNYVKNVGLESEK